MTLDHSNVEGFSVTQSVARAGSQLRIDGTDIGHFSVGGLSSFAEPGSFVMTRSTVRGFASMNSSTLVDAVFEDCRLRKSGWSRATLSGTSFKGTDLTGAIFRDARIDGVELSDANLTNAVLIGATGDPLPMSRTVWENTICPDGTNSDANGGTCVGHFLP